MSTQTILPAQTSSRDNLLGICAAVGEDFGFNPLWLRIALALGVLVNLEFAVGVYVALGLVVLASRLIAPTRRSSALLV